MPACPPLLPQEIVRRKRDGEALSEEEIAAFVAGLADGRVGEGQAAAFAMAVFFRGLSAEECVALTLAMRDSGAVLDWPDAPGPVLDKHSTGGVGDNVSLMLAPLVAACGGIVPMIAGRGLGHTGGTIDKLEAIPGYRIEPGIDAFRRAVAAAGCAIVGQTAELAPADRRLYAVRDVTATVESVPLITASILSKKLAAGVQGLALDVKAGSGAFMEEREEARRLARSLVTVAGEAGLRCSALITDMHQPLASAAGNAVEVRNAIDFLTGARRDPRLEEVVLALAGEMLALGGLVERHDAGHDAVLTALADGRAAERFARMVAALGGPADIVERPDAHLPQAPVIRPVPPRQSGTVAAVDCRAVGLAVVALGGGRTRPSGTIDPAVGFTGLAAVGETVDQGRPLGSVHARDEADAERAAEVLSRAYAVGKAPAARPVVLERIAGEG
jgi:thymidine phosphorylase